jgi:uncharacterized membrane protein
MIFMIDFFFNNWNGLIVYAIFSFKKKVMNAMFNMSKHGIHD